MQTKLDYNTQVERIDEPGTSWLVGAGAYSEDPFRALAEAAPDAIVVADSNGEIGFWNRSAEKMFGYTSAEVLRKPLTLLMPQRFRGLHRRGLERFLETEKPKVIGKTVELSGLKKDGTEFPLELSLATWSTPSGRFFGGILRNISERKRLADIFSRLFKSAPMGIYILHQGRFEFVNGQFLTLTGYSEAELLGRESLSFVVPEDRATVRESAVRMLKGAPSEGYEFRFQTKSGETRWAAATITSHIHEGKRSELGSFIDITEIKRANEKLGVLTDLVKSVLERDRLNQVLRSAIEKLRYLLSYDTTAVVLEEAPGLFMYRSASGYGARSLHGDKVPTDAFQEKVIHTRRAMMSTDPVTDGWSPAVLSKGFTSIVSAPLLVTGRAIGCLTAFNRAGKGAFTDKDLGLLNLFAQFVSLALEHADLYGKLRELADRDALTGLYNHRVLMESLQREIARAQRANRRFSILLIDIDKFKTVNDTYGHQAGDAVLRELGERLQAALRAGDIVGRYGGEEFLVVLPETESAGAVVASARLHQVISGSPFSVPGGNSLTLQVSIGVATYPDDATERPFLVASADLALYEAKHQGGGRTVAADWLPKR